MKIFQRYKYKSGAKVVRGEKPDFFQLLKKYSDKKFIALDLGCGSGELALKLSPFYKKIIGLDSCADYIKTANKDKKKKKILNVIFKIGDGKKLPFKNKTFDLIYSSRGPLSAGADFIKEGQRALKDNGLMVEETIGEKDKLELKKIFKRGQNYPYASTKLDSVKDLLKKYNIEPAYHKNFLYLQKFPSLNSVIRTLKRTPIVQDFNKINDKDKINKLSKLYKNGGIILSAHRLWWVGKKIK